jgi:hypothetical protein
MADWTPKRESIEGTRDFNVEESMFENKSDETRLITPDELIGFKITTPQLTYAQLQDYITFFRGKFGSLTSFTMLYPFDNTEYTVRFEKGSWRETYRSGSFQIEFSLKRVW